MKNFIFVLMILFLSLMLFGKATITFWGYETVDFSQKEIMAGLVDKFQLENNDIKVNMVYLPKSDFEIKLKTAAAVGELPDISYIDQPLLPLFAKDGLLLNITEYIEKDNLDLSNYIKGPLDTCIYKGEYYGLPISQTSVAMIYNKDLIAEPPKTWDELLEISKEIYIPGEVSAFEYLEGDGWGAWIIPAFVHSAGGEMVVDGKAVFNSQAGVDALNLMKELKKYSEKEVLDSANAFETGHIGMIVNGPWMLSSYRNNWPDLNFGIALIPMKEKYATNLGGEDIVIYSDSENKEASWKFIKFLTNKENAADMAMVMGNFPTRIEATSDSRFNKDPEMSMFMEQMKYSFARPTAINWLKINDEIIGKAIGEVLSNEKTPQEALNDAVKAANELLKEE